MKAKTLNRLADLEARLFIAPKKKPLQIHCIYEDSAGNIIKGAELLDRPGPALYVRIVKTIEPCPAAGSDLNREDLLIEKIKQLEARKAALKKGRHE